MQTIATVHLYELLSSLKNITVLQEEIQVRFLTTYLGSPINYDETTVLFTAPMIG